MALCHEQGCATWLHGVWLHGVWFRGQRITVCPFFSRVPALAPERSWLSAARGNRAKAQVCDVKKMEQVDWMQADWMQVDWTA